MVRVDISQDLKGRTITIYTKSEDGVVNCSVEGILDFVPVLRNANSGHFGIPIYAHQTNDWHYIGDVKGGIKEKVIINEAI